MVVEWDGKFYEKCFRCGHYFRIKHKNALWESNHGSRCFGCETSETTLKNYLGNGVWSNPNYYPIKRNVTVDKSR